MSALDPVRQMLADRGCPDDLIAGGLAGLASKWESVVESVEQGYQVGLDDYLNDMDMRDLLAAALAVAPHDEADAVASQIAALDQRLLAVTLPARCLWGEDVEDDDGLDPGRDWWYYRRPVQLNQEFADELAAWGLTDDVDGAA